MVVGGSFRHSLWLTELKLSTENDDDDDVDDDDVDDDDVDDDDDDVDDVDESMK